jgi:hypothetical protein
MQIHTFLEGHLVTFLHSEGTLYRPILT